jgi:pilus assembly protein CpaC
LLIKKDGTQTTLVINVFARPPEVVRRELEQLLEGATGLNVRQVGSRFFIEGGVNTEAEAKRVQQIAALYVGQVESLVTVGGPALDRKFNIRIDFFFVQYDKQSSYAVGVNYPATIGGPSFTQGNVSYDFLAGTTTTATASIVNQPLPGLDIAASRGWAKVMKQATVITQNGTEATFENGGEQNFQITAGLTASIQKIQYGTNVVVLPRFDPQTRDMEIRLQADVADLIPPIASTPLPGRQTSKLVTNVHMKLGQSVVLSGIRTQSQRKNIQGLPLLSELPIFGLLFGSHSGSKEDIEGAVFIIPSVVEAVPRNTVDLVSFAMKQYERYTGDFDDVNAYDKRPPMPKDDAGAPSSVPVPAPTPAK